MAFVPYKEKPYEYQEYPKWIERDGKSIIVNSKEEEFPVVPEVVVRRGRPPKVEE